MINLIIGKPLLRTRFEKMISETDRGGRRRIFVSTGAFIRDHLLIVGKDYPFRMYQLLKEKKEKRGAYVGSYQSFRNHIFWLRKLGLIEFVREEPSSNPHFQPRRYYRIVEGKEDAEGWINPRKKLYPQSWKEHHR